jgi:hypothetical protein
MAGTELAAKALTCKTELLLRIGANAHDQTSRHRIDRPRPVLRDRCSADQTPQRLGTGLRRRNHPAATPLNSL